MTIHGTIEFDPGNHRIPWSRPIEIKEDTEEDGRSWWIPIAWILGAALVVAAVISRRRGSHSVRSERTRLDADVVGK